ncbi:MAG: hypothetical protein NC393_05080 [Clostridium sp.]|nr:hypothetical protein [Clostridium sp.]MCM1209407.1 hypothetical protein [Ruminococcus sp.]
MSKEMLHGLIDMIPEDETETIYRVLIKFVPEVPLEPDEIEAIAEGRRDREENGTISHDAINWD